MKRILTLALAVALTTVAVPASANPRDQVTPIEPRPVERQLIPPPTFQVTENGCRDGVPIAAYSIKEFEGVSYSKPTYGTFAEPSIVVVAKVDNPRQARFTNGHTVVRLQVVNPTWADCAGEVPPPLDPMPELPAPTAPVCPPPAPLPLDPWPYPCA
ncbi:hypothetical protein [Aquipuribacter sp. MA13-6]|uniref:hypothetical protein n=1 Tax=unclassified Aquipuribacter TaxID=2635084 RepID=UPI003EEEE80E